MEMIQGNGRNRPADIFGITLTVDGGESFRIKFVIMILNLGRHIGGDDARSDFKNADVLFRRQCDIKGCHHRYNGFGNKILTSLRGCGECTDRRYIDYLGTQIGILSFLPNHPVGDCLGQKVGPLLIYPHQPVKAFFRSNQGVFTHLGRHTGIVDQNV